MLWAAAVTDLPFGLHPHLIGGGRLEQPSPGVIRMLAPPAERGYVDAQVDDYQGLRRGKFPWAPPLQLSLRARASHPSPPGTLGFGFWNDPFGVSLGGAGGVRRFPAAPQAMWFFYGSPPNEFGFGGQTGGRVAAGSGVRARGDRAGQTPPAPWRAAVIRSPALPAWLVAPGAALAFLLAAVPVVRIPVVRAIRWAVAGAEAAIATPLDEWHSYAIAWQPEQIRFEVDGRPVLRTRVSPHGRLGFVAWIDNQYAVLSERRGIRFGTLPIESENWLEIADLVFESS